MARQKNHFKIMVKTQDLDLFWTLERAADLVRRMDPKARS